MFKIIKNPVLFYIEGAAQKNLNLMDAVALRILGTPAQNSRLTWW